MGQKIADQAHRDGVAEQCPAPAVQKRSDVDLALMDHDDHVRRDVALCVLTTAPPHDAHTRDLRRTVPGIGASLRLVVRDASHASRRCPRGQAFVSYGRFVTCAQESAGTPEGPSGTTRGKADRQWACSEAAVRCWRANPAGQTSLTRVENQHRQAKALTVLAPQ